MTEPQTTNWRFDAAAAGLLFILVSCLLWKIAAIGPTVDEPFHLSRGLAWWWTDSTKMSYAHPPLANVLQTLPAAALPPPIALESLPGWDDANHAQFSEYLFAKKYNVIRPLLMAGRVVTVGLSVLFGAFIYFWTSRRFSEWLGLIALALYITNPTILAHSQLVTTDLPVSFAMFGVVATFVDYLSPLKDSPSKRWVNLAIFASVFGLASATKFTTVALIPILGVIGIMWAWMGNGRFAAGRRPINIARVCGEMVGVAVVTIVIIGAMYRFQHVGLTMAEVLARPEPEVYLTEEFRGKFLEQRTFGRLVPGWVPIPVPYTWWYGFEMVRYHATKGHPTWFMGWTYDLGNPAYFPVVVAIKTPAIWLIGLVSGVFFALRDRKRLPLAVGIPAVIAAWLLFTLCSSSLNIGVRHALPFVGIATILSAYGLLNAWHSLRPRLGGASRWVAGAVAASLLVGPISYAGRYLSYFNIGDLGLRISVVGEDWGQDAAALATAIKEHDMQFVRYVPYGIGSRLEARFHGAKFSTSRCGSINATWGWFVVHRAKVVRWPECIKGYAKHPPDLVIGDHLFAYKLRDLKSGKSLSMPPPPPRQDPPDSRPSESTR